MNNNQQFSTQPSRAEIQRHQPPEPNQLESISTQRIAVSPTFTNISSNNSISSSYIDRATPTTKAVLQADPGINPKITIGLLCFNFWLVARWNMSLSISHQCSTTTHSFLSLEIYSKSHINVYTLWIFSEDACNDANLDCDLMKNLLKWLFALKKVLKGDPFSRRYQKLSHHLKSLPLDDRDCI